MLTNEVLAQVRKATNENLDYHRLSAHRIQVSVRADVVLALLDEVEAARATNGV